MPQYLGALAASRGRADTDVCALRSGRADVRGLPAPALRTSTFRTRASSITRTARPRASASSATRRTDACVSSRMASPTPRCPCSMTRMESPDEMTMIMAAVLPLALHKDPKESPTSGSGRASPCTRCSAIRVCSTSTRSRSSRRCTRAPRRSASASSARTRIPGRASMSRMQRRISRRMRRSTTSLSPSRPIPGFWRRKPVYARVVSLCAAPSQQGRPACAMDPALRDQRGTRRDGHQRAQRIVPGFPGVPGE